jgi:hypothetical protein
MVLVAARPLPFNDAELKEIKAHMRAEIRRFSKAPPISRDLQMTGSGADQAPSIRRSP